MTLEFFPCLLLGHGIGDYLLQNNWMAMNKSRSSFKCAVHCALYTVAICATTWPFIHDWEWAGLVFFSHYVIDRWSTIDLWLKFIRGRSLEVFMVHGKEGIPEGLDKDNYHALRAAFAGLVYAAADNTAHLVLMYYGAWLLQR